MAAAELIHAAREREREIEGGGETGSDVDTELISWLCCGVELQCVCAAVCVGQQDIYQSESSKIASVKNVKRNAQDPAVEKKSSISNFQKKKLSGVRNKIFGFCTRYMLYVRHSETMCVI